MNKILFNQLKYLSSSLSDWNEITKADPKEQLDITCNLSSSVLFRCMEGEHNK